MIKLILFHRNCWCQGRSYTVSEKQLLKIHGLLPPAVASQEDEVNVAVLNIERCSTDLDKYIYLMDLLARNERLFYRVVMENVEMTMPLIYTPTVGLACENFGILYRHPQYVIEITDAAFEVWTLILSVDSN